MSSYDIAKQMADETDEQIISYIVSKKNIKVEAGAGSGKTYSLHKVIDWFVANKMKEFKKQKRQIACITYTNAAVEVIKQRIGTIKEIVPSTIHSFAWENIKQFPSPLKDYVKDLSLVNEEEFLQVKSVNYTLGVRYIENNVLYLYHDDVIRLFCKFLDSPKFRLLLEHKYAAILIDEYQDSYSEIMDKLLKHFVDIQTRLQICLFGDSWQTIYQTNNACGEVKDANLKVISKKVNFRSAQKIVELLNRLRPELPQITAIDDCNGDICVVDCNDYIGMRRTDRYFRDDLPQTELNKRLSVIENKFKYEGETLKTLMITHKVLASYQGYDNLLKILDDRLKDSSDQLFNFVADVIENIYQSLLTNDFSLMYETLKSRPPINTRNEKKKWRQLFNNIRDAREKTIFDVLRVVIDSKLIPTPTEIIGLYNDMFDDIDKEYHKGKLLDLKNIKYKEFVATKEYFMPFSIYSTDHGVKGEEYDNIVFVLSKGWANYQFDKFLPLSEDEINEDNIDKYIRNRNLFYVACSRAKKRLCLLVTFPVGLKFKNYLEGVFGKENYYSYNEFIEKF